MGFSDWSEADRKALEEHLSKNYLLIPKNRIYQIVGGLLAFVIAGFGVSYSGVLSVLRTEAAEQTRQRIIAMEKESKSALSQIKLSERHAEEMLTKLRSGEVESLVTKRITVVDETGATRISLMTSHESGLPSILLKDAQNKTRVSLYENETGYAGLSLIDRDGKQRVTLSTDPKDGRPSFHLKDAQNKTRVSLYENEYGYAGLGLLDRDGKWRVVLYTDPKDGLPSLEFWDSNGQIVNQRP